MQKSILVLTGLLFSTGVLAEQQKGWFVKPFMGISSLSDQSGTASNSNGLDGDIDVATDSGLAAGLGVGYRYNERLSVELYWEYRRNDSDSTIGATGEVLSGNYASNLFYLNGYYDLYRQEDWSVYAGAGIGWTQEIDIDLERNGIEQSYSGDGDISWQVMLGTDYQLSQNWALNAEVRYSSMSSIYLEGEENAVGQISGFDYDPLTIGLGLKYHF